MEPETEHVALRERLSGLVFRLDASLTNNPTGLSQDDRIRLSLKREEVAELKGALLRAREESRRLKESMSYPSPVQMAEEAVRTRRRKLRQATAECNEWRRLLAPFGPSRTKSDKADDEGSEVWKRRATVLRTENGNLQRRLNQVEELVRDKHGWIVERDRKFRDSESAEIDRLERQVRMLKNSSSHIPICNC
jgi:transposase